MSRIAVIGLVGRSMFFDVPRFHSGGETIHATGFYEEWGGKGFNQAVAAARQDAAVAFLGACSADDKKAIEDFARREGVVARMCAKKRATACASIMTDGSGETRVTVYPGAELEAKDVDGFAGSIATADFLLLGNEVPEKVNLAAVDIARKYGVKIVLNPAPARRLPKGIADAVSVFTPNEFEEASVGDVPAEVVTTLGERGCRIRSTGEVIPSPSVHAVDSTGAGDTFTGVLSARLAEGEDISSACRAAVAAAAECVAARYVIPAIPQRNSSDN